MKGIKLFISFVCYFGIGIAFIDMQRSIPIGEVLDINPKLQLIVFWLFIIFWIIKILWFTYSRFYLEAKERKQAMNKKDKDEK